jgi:Secretion system C-terminal sorting domain
MKNLIYLFLFFTISSSFAQRIHFEYDAAGNQIERKLCLTCSAKANAVTKQNSELKPEDLKKFLPEDNFSYYPNPVKEELFLKWENLQNNSITNIKLINLNGVVLKSYETLEFKLEQNILFQDYAMGMYILQLTYSNGEEKTIKIIKQ